MYAQHQQVRIRRYQRLYKCRGQAAFWVLPITLILKNLNCCCVLQVRPVNSGTATLKDATSEAIRDWVTNVETTHYILGSAAGPHPYPAMVREFQSVIGKEVRQQCMDKWGGKPDVLVACIGGGSNAIGLFHDFVEDEDVRLIGACPILLHYVTLFERSSAYECQCACVALKDHILAMLSLSLSLAIAYIILGELTSHLHKRVTCYISELSHHHHH